MSNSSYKRHRVESLIKLFSEPLIHLLITISFVLLTVTYEKAVEHASQGFLFFYWICCFTLIILFIIVSIISFFNRRSQLKREEIIQKDKELELERKNPVRVYFRKNDYDINNVMLDEAYRISLDEVKNAKREIWIVADYSPKLERLTATIERQEYYEEILRILKKKNDSKDGGDEFRYVRYMQRPYNIYHLIKQNDGKIDNVDWILGDEQAFAHCKQVIKLNNKKNPNKIKIELHVTPIIPSLPSILIVDDSKMLFTIPRRKDNTEREFQQHLDPVETAGVMVFTDNSEDGKTLVKPFKNIIATLTSEKPFDKGESYIIKSIDDFSDKNAEFKRWFNYKKHK